MSVDRESARQRDVNANGGPAPVFTSAGALVDGSQVVGALSPSYP